MTYTTEQADFIADPHPRRALVAPAGSGKTHTLAGAAAAVLDRSTAVQGSRVIALTFTHRAAAELSARLDGRAHCTTFHGFAASLKDSHERVPYTLYDETDAGDVLREVGKDLGILTGQEKDARKAADKVRRDQSAARRYQSVLRRSNAVDFDMLISDAEEIVRAHHVRSAYSDAVFLLDEMQDADARQWSIVEALDPAGIVMVGDPRQTIYEWRQADPSILLRRLEDPSWHRHELTQNFRSARAVVTLANRAGLATGLGLSPMVGVRPQAGSVHRIEFATTGDEALHVAKWAAARSNCWDGGKPAVFILGRTWADLEPIGRALRLYGVSHLSLAESSSFWSRPAPRALSRLMALSVNPACDWMARSVANWPDAVITRTELLEAEERAAFMARPLTEVLAGRRPDVFSFWARERRTSDLPTDADSTLRHLLAVTCIEDSLRTSGRTSQLDDVTEAVRRVKAWTDEAYAAGMRCSPAAWCRWFAGRQAADEATEAPIWLSTVHGVKGLEADHVAIVGLRQGGFDHRTDEDARLFFVAASRARESVMLTYSTENVWKPSEVRAASEFWEMGGEM